MRNFAIVLRDSLMQPLSGWICSDELQSQLQRYLLKTICNDLVNAVFGIYASDVMMAVPDDKEFTAEV
jgi:hypothetical protein